MLKFMSNNNAKTKNKNKTNCTRVDNVRELKSIKIRIAKSLN